MYLFFDTETTGLPLSWNAPASNTSNWPRMVQLACLLTDPDGIIIEQRNFIIKPEGYTIPSEASNIHGITTERANREGLDLNASLSDFSSLLVRATHLVAHNMEFDEKIVGAEFHRKFGADPLPSKAKFCTMKNPQVIEHCSIPPFRYGSYKWPKLSELHKKLFGVDFDEAHDASVDIKATAKCFFELRRIRII
ncbi:MAG: 3'-5' exonuclease [Lewinellaceae bacterium]|nr:3'-5' exonuclease [Lewinellaceae bacterium]